MPDACLRYDGDRKGGRRLREQCSQAVGPTHRWTVRVYYEDTDCGGVVYHTAYLCFLERARTEWLRSRGVEQRRLRERLGYVFAVRGLGVEYPAPALLDDELVIASGISRLGRTRAVFDQAIHRVTDAGEACCKAQVEVVCINAASGRPRTLPDWMLTELPDGR